MIRMCKYTKTQQFYGTLKITRFISNAYTPEKGQYEIIVQNYLCPMP